MWFVFTAAPVTTDNWKIIFLPKFRATHYHVSVSCLSSDYNIQASKCYNVHLTKIAANLYLNYHQLKFEQQSYSYHDNASKQSYLLYGDQYIL